MASSTPTAVQAGFGSTERKDAWWLQPLAVAIGLGIFVVYTTWAAFQDQNYTWGPYLSPLYSPLLFGAPHHAWLGAGPPSWWPGFLPWSPALLILWAPAGFRVTCYYYRKAYYRAYFLDPPACAVGEFGEHRYKGETAFPLILQNIHRYFMYLALLFIVVLSYDAVRSFFFEDGFGLGIGSLVLTANATLLAGYTFGCHSLRHLTGGKLNCYSCGAAARARHGMWKGVTWFNRQHQLWAWMSLFWVGFTDLYVRLVAMGVWTDWRIL